MPAALDDDDDDEDDEEDELDEVEAPALVALELAPRRLLPPLPTVMLPIWPDILKNR